MAANSQQQQEDERKWCREHTKNNRERGKRREGPWKKRGSEN
jgi:hypothetical protein